MRQLLTHSGGPAVVGPALRGAHGARRPTSSASWRWTSTTSRGRSRSTATSASSSSATSSSGWAARPLEELARRRVFEPLGMTDTLYRPPVDPPSPDRPHGERPVAGSGPASARCTTRTPSPSEGVAPHAGLFSTAGDLARFAQALLDGGALDGRRIVSRRHGRALHPARRAARLHPGPGLGHAHRRDRSRAAPPRAEPGYSSAGSLLSAALLRPHRLHRDLDVDGPGAGPLRHPAHQPRAPHA